MTTSLRSPRSRRAGWSRNSASCARHDLRHNSLVVHGAIPDGAEPLGDDHLVSRDHRLAAVHGGLVGRAVGVEIVPEQRHAGLRREGVIELGESRAAAFHALVEIDHEGPGAVAACAGEAQEFLAAGFEIIPVRLELLADVVTLRLDALRVFGADAQGLAYLFVDADGHRALQVRKVRGLAGAVITVAVVEGDVRGPEVMGDEGGEPLTFLAAQEVVEDVELEFRTVEPAQLRWHAPDQRRWRQVAAGQRVMGGANGVQAGGDGFVRITRLADRKSTRLNSSHSQISYAVFCLKKKTCPPCARDHTPAP